MPIHLPSALHTSWLNTSASIDSLSTLIVSIYHYSCPINTLPKLHSHGLQVKHIKDLKLGSSFEGQPIYGGLLQGKLMPGTGYGQLSMDGEVTGHWDISSKVILLNGYAVKCLCLVP